MEVQVRVNTGGSVAGSVSNWKVISPGIETYQSALSNIRLNLTWSLGQVYTPVAYDYSEYPRDGFGQD